jgi:CRISPR/Cas system-associated exonuclease Cas4 (RecB family)
MVKPVSEEEHKRIALKMKLLGEELRRIVKRQKEEKSKPIEIKKSVRDPRDPADRIAQIGHS